MRKDLFLTVPALVLLGTLAVAAKPPAKSSPTFTDNGTTLSVSGSLAGLAAGDLEISLSASGTETVICSDSGGMDPPPTPVTLAGTKVVTIPLGEKNAASFEDLVTLAPPAPVCSAGGAEAIAGQHDVAFTNAHIEIRPVQANPDLPPPSPVRCIQCAFKQATVDGPALPQSCFTMSSC